MKKLSILFLATFLFSCVPPKKISSWEAYQIKNGVDTATWNKNHAVNTGYLDSTENTFNGFRSLPDSVKKNN